jgi:small subunit ribosomal protein S16
MLVLRMSRHGAKKRPFYHIVVADSRFPRDGRYLEKVGTYNPMLSKDNPKRVILNEEHIKEWIKKGAQPSERVARFLHTAGLGPEVKYRESPKKSAPRAKTQDRLKAVAEGTKAAEAPAAEAPSAPAAAPAEKPAA